MARTARPAAAEVKPRTSRVPGAAAPDAAVAETDPADGGELAVLVLGEGLDPKALAPALPGFTLRPLAGLAPGEAGTALLCLVVEGGEAAATQALDDAGLTGLPVQVWHGDAAALAAAIAARLQAVLADAGAARRDAALLRREDEALNRRFKALEDFIWAIGGPHASLALHWTPGAGVAISADAEAEAETEAGDAPAAAVRQPLPLDIRGLAAVEMLLPEADTAEATTLEVAIEDSEGKRHPLDFVPFSAGRGDGWLRFAAAQPLSVDAQDGSLTVTGAGARTVFGLGLPVPAPDFAVQGLATGEDVTLALRVWKGVAGSAGATAAGAPDSGGTSHLRLLPADLPAPALLSGHRGARDYVAAEFWINENAFLVHPSAQGPVFALVSRVPAEGLRRASAVVNAARPDSAVLGFALGLAPTGQATPANARDFLGQWLFLPPGAWGEVHALASPEGIAAGGRLWDLVLATCVAGDAPNTNGWALFRSFRLSLGVAR